MGRRRERTAPRPTLKSRGRESLGRIARGSGYLSFARIPLSRVPLRAVPLAGALPAAFVALVVVLSLPLPGVGITDPPRMTSRLVAM